MLGMEAIHRIEVLSKDECVTLMTSVPVGRLVFTDRALPAILPVTFVVDGDSVVVRTARGSRLARAVDGAVVAFEVDAIDPHQSAGWSVVVTAVSRLETDPAEVDRLAAALTAWVPGVKDVFIRVPLTVVTGRRVTRRPVRSAVRAAT